ncbi:MAG: thioredoxin [bacterium]
MAVKPLDVTDATFDGQVLKSDQPVLVDFWATWCPPCRMLAPAVEEIAGRMTGTLKVCKVDVDENPAIAQTYAIRSVPTLLIFKKGQVVKRLVGVRPREEIEREIQAVLT